MKKQDKNRGALEAHESRTYPARYKLDPFTGRRVAEIPPSTAQPPAPVKVEKPKPAPSKAEKPKSGTVLIGANFTPEVAGALRLVQADIRNWQRTKKSLLAEAINDLCLKYGVKPVADTEN